MADEETEDTPKKKKPLLLIILGVNVLLGGGAAAFFFLSGNASAGGGGGGGGHGGGHGEAAASDHGGGHGASDDHGGGGGGGHGGGHGGGAKASGPMVDFEPMVVNLNEPEGTRYLKIAFSVQLTNSKMADPVEAAKPMIRDHFIRELSDLNFRQTMGNKNKLAIKRRLLKRLNEAVGDDAAVEIHITQFIVQ